MAVTKLSNSGTSGAKYSSIMAENTYMEPIATTVLGTTTSTITFSNIPQNYTHLQLRFIAQDANTSAVFDLVAMQFNNDASSANYTYHRVYGDGSGANIGGYGTGNVNYIASGYVSTSATGQTNMFGTGIVDILDYSNTSTYKTVRTLSGIDKNAVGGQISLMSGLWLNTSAVTKIVLTPQSGSFITYSRFSLYGLRG